MYSWKFCLGLSMFLLFGSIVTGSYLSLCMMIGWYYIALDLFNKENLS